jgi:hypothetical protein
MRVLVANTPLMYRESLALSIQRARPNFEVLLAEPEKLNGEVESLAPHALVRDDDGVETSSPNGVVCWDHHRQSPQRQDQRERAGL